jgi:endonuclease/exonuclease/phosphatase family metal-dependent hydrolase
MAFGIARLLKLRASLALRIDAANRKKEALAEICAAMLIGGYHPAMRICRCIVPTIFLGLLLAVACDAGRPAAMDLRVMTFNIEWGGTHVNFDKVVEAIRRSGADVVGVQEAEGNLVRLASELGWHFDLRNYAISRFPLLNPGGADGRYVLVEVQPGKVVALLNVHLPSDPYGPDLVRDGAEVAEVLALERRIRLPKIRPYLDTARELIASNIPLFLTGDFNTPAHTDWTRDMVGRRPFLRYPVAWPVTVAAEEAGLSDAWRSAHTEVAADPGLTWWAGRPPLELYAPGANDAEDRIDFIWFAGPAELLASELVGEPGTAGAQVTVSPWPSDHRAVVADFRVVPADVPPLLATNKAVYLESEGVDIRYRNVLKANLRIEKVAETARRPDPGAAEISGSGQLSFPREHFPTGAYLVSLDQPGRNALRTEFWVLDKNAIPEVRLSGNTFDVGQELPIAWQNAPGHRNDYLAIFAEGAETTYDGAATWAYINALPAGKLSFGAAGAEGAWPVPAGRYVIRLIKDDGYEVLAESDPFVIR